MTKTAQQKENIILWVVVILGIFALIGGKTWLDLAGQKRATTENSDYITYGYMAENEFMLEETSKHGRENVLYVGTITPNGLVRHTNNMAFNLSKANPLTLYFKFAGIAPYDRMQHNIDLIKKIVQEYNDRGGDINEIIIDYRPDHIDQFNFKNFNTFAGNLRTQLRREHTLGAFLDERWFKTDDPEKKELARRRLGNMSKNIRTYFFDFHNVYNADEGDDVVEVKKYMDEYKFAYILRVTSQEERDKLYKALRAPSGFFVGTLVDIPKTPPISQETNTSGETE